MIAACVTAAGRYGFAVDVRLISDEGVVECAVADLPEPLARESALVWVDIPGCDARAVEVLTEVFGFHPMALARNQEPYMETVTTDVWRLEQRVTGGDVGDPVVL